MKRTYNVYHTDFIILFILGLLNEKELKNIPKSTQQSWKQRDFSRSIRSEYSYYLENKELIEAFLANKTLLNAAKGLYFIYCTLVSIMDDVRGVKAKLRKSRETIIKTIENVEPLMGLKRACRFFKITVNQFYTWKRKVNCALSPLNECIKQQPLRTSASELQMIKEFVQNPEYKDYHLSSIHCEMERQGGAFVSPTTFYKYAKLFDNVPDRKRFKAKQKIGIRAAKPKEILHADVCIYKPLDHTKIYIYFVVDNYSRMILGWKVALRCCSSVTLENLRNVYFTHFFENEDPPAILMVDGGSENKGDVRLAIENQEIRFRIWVAQQDIIQSNSMVESINKRMKYDFLYRQELLDFEQTKRYLAIAVERYNNRPLPVLSGLTPNEVFSGEIPDKNRFAFQRQQAKILRIAENKATTCTNCAFTVEKQEEK